MAIPVTYNLRNLVVRKTTTLMTALGIALTVAVLLAMMALLTGLRATLSASGDPLQIIVMRKGSESELVSKPSPRQVHRQALPWRRTRQASHVWPRRLGSGRRHGRRPDRPKQRDFRRPQPGQFRPATRRRAELGPGAGHRCRRGRRIAEQHQ